MSEFLDSKDENYYGGAEAFSCNSALCLDCALTYINQVEESEEPVTHCGICGHCLLISVNN